ncbi:EipB family protein, partial [Brevundimonas denitrificans]
MTDKIAYRLSILFSLFGLFAVVAPALSHAGGVALASHRAVYDLTLKEFHRDGGIEDVRGRIVMEVENSCEGVLMNQRMLVELLNISGDSM